MMKYLLVILILLVSFTVKAQQRFPTGFPTQFNTGFNRWGYAMSDSGLIVANRDTNWLAKYSGTIVFKPSNKKFYWFDSTTLTWNAFADAIDTTSLSNRINLKLNISDTTNKWWSINKRFVDTVYRVNDSTIGFTINNGAQQTFQILGRAPSGGGGAGTVTSVGLSMPSAFNVTPASITTSGAFAVTVAGTSLEYIRGNGTLATFDTTAIPNFYLKVRGLLSGTSPITFNQTTGAIGITNANTSGTKGAATFNNADFSDNGSGTISLADVISAGSCNNCNLTYDANGRLITATSGTGGGGSIDTAINIGTGVGVFKETTGDTLNFKTFTEAWGVDISDNPSDLQISADSSEVATQFDLSLVNNGLSRFGDTTQLGQSVGAAGNPAALNSDREVPLNGFRFGLSGTGSFGVGIATPSLSYRMSVISTGSTGGVNVSTGTGVGVNVNSANNAITGFSSTATGVSGSTLAGVGGYGVQGSGGIGGIGGRFYTIAAGGDASPVALELERQPTGAGVTNGAGFTIMFRNAFTNGTTGNESGRITNYFSNAVSGVQSSAFGFHLVNNAVSARKALLASTGQWTWDGYPGIVQKTDTTNIKPLGYNTTTGVVEPMAAWAGGVAASGSAAANQLTYWTSATTIGGDLGMTVNATTNTITADSLQLNNHLSFAGDIGPTTTEAIRFGRPGDYFHTFDDAGNSGGKLWMVYPKFACDTCRNNQPFYATVSTTEYDVAQSPNSVFDYLAIGDGSFERPLLRLAVEQDFYDTWEIHFPETKPRNSNARDRPMSMAINKTTRRATNIYRFEDQMHTNSLGTYQYFRLTPPVATISPYYSTYEGLGRITLSVNDSTTNGEMGGFRLDVQNNAGVDKSLYQHFGEQISHNTPAGFYNLSSAVGAESNVNYGYYVTSGNTGRIMDIGKIGASTIAMQVHNNGRITLNRADQADDGNIFQVYATGSQAAITARVDNTGTNDVSYPLDVIRFSSGTVAAGFGFGIRFRSQNTSGGFPYIGNISTVYTDVAGSTEDADYVFNLIRAGSVTEAFRVKSTGAAVFNNAFTFPTTDGTNGQVLQTNGSGVVTWQTPSGGGITTLNTLTASTQTFATGTTGADFNISSSASTHTFNIPDASTTARGAVTTGTQSFAGDKTFTTGAITTQPSASQTPTLVMNGNRSLGVAPGISGIGFSVSAINYTNTAAAGTETQGQNFNLITAPTLTSSNAVTYTGDVATLRVTGAPISGGSSTIDHPYNILANDVSKFSGIAMALNEQAADATIGAASGVNIYTGSGGNTWTLPALAAHPGKFILIKNAGSGNLTVQRGGSDNIYTTASVTSFTVAAGADVVIAAGSSFWYVLGI